MELDKIRTKKIIKAALNEDIGSGDVTTMNTVHKLESVKAAIVANEDLIMCGMDIAEWTINAVDYSVRFKPQVEDGGHAYKGKEIVFLEGHARAILSAERTMLNFLCFLSGIATKVNAFAEIAKKYGVKIYDTRKTFPLLRYLEKYAVTVGGGYNHRLGLWDQVLIKDNHIKVGNLSAGKTLISEIRKKITKNIKVEIEVEDLEEFRVMLAQRPEIIMLDNMAPDDIKEAVKLRNKIASAKRPLLEVSGGINIENIEEYAKTGIDHISIGSLTDSVESIDMSLEIV
ncbi:MAG: carboxylating nicotinate-nucleotide diphosphorylase [Candidatus Omnitrophica bacterium]|nr:carboxylating nicotinate-nucleotide diphosphorylase [Candidatus Omnitrophota bacterium]